jgi:hypothetical protein
MNTSPEYRFERKFLTTELSRAQVELLVRNHPEKFTEIYHERRVNNIYFDTPGFMNYYDNAEGNTQRQKYRVRWYGETFGSIPEPVLECKIKQGMVGTKKSWQLSPMALDKSFSRSVIRNAAADLPVPVRDQFFSMYPVLVNSYSRRYFLSQNKLFRITIDYDLTFYSIGSTGFSMFSPKKDPATVVMELKYNSESEAEARLLLNFSPLSVTKSSKYVQGLNQIMEF